MVPLIGRIGSAAALTWTLLAASVPGSPLCSYDFSDAVYRRHGIDPSRIEERLELRPGASVTDRAPAADRRATRALEVRGGYDSTGSPVYFFARGSLNAAGFVSGPRDADRRVFLFPRRGSPSDGAPPNLRQEPLFDTTSGVHPLGLWKAAFVHYTDRPFSSPAGLATLEEIRGRNGTDLDGTPLLKHVSEIAQLEKSGFVRVDGGPLETWRIWPIWADPRRERPGPDAYLDILSRADGSAVEQELERNFVCLQKIGDFLHRPMPRLPPFVQPLPIPKVVEAGESLVLPVRPFAHRFHPDLPPSTLWGYDGTFPGPTLRVRRGAPLLVQCMNELTLDGNLGFGHPRVVCRPDSSGYRDGALGFSAQNVYKGLAGFILATDPFDSGDENSGDPRASRLPSGPFDIPLMFSDKEFDSTLNRPLAWDPFERDAFLGSFDTVNGAVQPILRVARRKVRFRLLDAGPSRTYDLRWSNGRPFILIGSDGEFLETALETKALRLGVGQMRDVVVDFSPVPLGSEILLESGTRRLMKVVVDRDAPDPSRVPAKLRDPRVVPADLPTRTFVVENPRGAWTVNGQAFDLERPHARVKRGTQEIWVIRNQSQDRRHPIEFRSGPFRVLSPREELLPGDEVRLLATFGNATGRFVLPCANAVHADQGLMIGWEVGP